MSAKPFPSVPHAQSSQFLCDLRHPWELEIYNTLGRPVLHRHTSAAQWDLRRMRRELAPNLVASSRTRLGKRSQASREEATLANEHLLFHLSGEVFVSVEPLELTAYARCPVRAARASADLRRRFARPKPGPEPFFFVLRLDPDGPDFERVPLRRRPALSEGELALHYGEDFVDWQNGFVTRLREGAHGVSLFRGEPGTGKTTFIRHLIESLHETHRFHYLPVTNQELLSNPSMTGFWSHLGRNSREHVNVLILEDAEAVLAECGGGSRGPLANLLNIADGLMGDLVQVHVMCTVNCSLERLDPALIRPGRLVGGWHFRRLTPTQAGHLAAARGIVLPPQTDYSLAEIYAPPVTGHVESNARRIGFGN